MTIKTRNRINLSLFIISLVFLLLNITLFLISFYTGNFSLKSYKVFAEGNFILTKYMPSIVVASISFEGLYVTVMSFLMYRIFEKTQATDIVFFTLFLGAILLDTFRLYIPIFCTSQSYTKFILFITNAVVCSKILIPFSLFFVVINGGTTQRQDVERNLFLIILAAFFVALMIPVNSAVPTKTFSLDYSYKKITFVLSLTIITSSLIAEFFINKNSMYSQKTTIGLALICFGITHIIGASDILAFALSSVTLVTGTIIFLLELHHQYLFND